ncbi:MAG TPA: transcriptional regulator [Pyrinomonadaceae bacterium]|nr:transcriptional regulator [Pyrinomonadaceae bacterium]
MAKQNALAKDRSKAKAGAQSPHQDLSEQRRGAKTAEGPARAAELDRLIHERVRLAIISALAVNDSLTFNDLKQLLNTTDGNLSVHARKLEEAQYVVCKKYFDGRTPKTEYRLTAAGRKALERYLGHMETVIRAARGG